MITSGRIWYTSNTEFTELQENISIDQGVQNTDANTRNFSIKDIEKNLPQVILTEDAEYLY